MEDSKKKVNGVRRRATAPRFGVWEGVDYSNDFAKIRETKIEEDQALSLVSNDINKEHVIPTISFRRRNSPATDRYDNVILSDDRNGGETRNLNGRNNCHDASDVGKRTPVPVFGVWGGVLDYSGDFAKIRGTKVEDEHTLSSPISTESKKELVIRRPTARSPPPPCPPSNSPPPVAHDRTDHIASNLILPDDDDDDDDVGGYDTHGLNGRINFHNSWKKIRHFLGGCRKGKI